MKQHDKIKMFALLLIAKLRAKNNQQAINIITDTLKELDII